MMKRILGGVSLSIIVSCSPSPSPVQAPAPAPAPPAVAEQVAPPSPSASRADALIEDMRRREAAQAKLDRENPPPPAPRLEDVMRAVPAPVAPTAQTAVIRSSEPVAATTVQSTVAPAADARGEQWWKDQARNLQTKVEEDTRLMEQARTAMVNSTLKITLDEAEREYRTRVAALQNSRAALARLRDDARRASVPAGWARWP